MVNCPATGNLVADFETITAPNTSFLEWASFVSYNFGQGLVSDLHEGYTTTATGTDLGPATNMSIAGTPPAADGWWYLLKGAGGGGGYCNEGSTYGSTARDAALP